MASALRLSGYQGARSVHTRGLHVLADVLRRGNHWPQVVVEPDVTARGKTARSLFDDIEVEPAAIAYMASSYLTARVPLLSLFDAPYTIGNRELAFLRLDGSLGEALRVEVERRTRYRVLGYWDNGVRHISNRVRAIRVPDDCTGLVIRTLDNAIYVDTLKSFGCEPLVADVRDFLGLVASGRVDAQENPLTNLLTFRLYEHHPFVSLTGHIFGVALLVCNADWHDGLSSQERIELGAGVQQATAAQRRFSADDDAAALNILAMKGVQVLGKTDIDLDAFSRACESVRRGVLERLDPALVAQWSSD